MKEALACPKIPQLEQEVELGSQAVQDLLLALV